MKNILLGSLLLLSGAAYADENSDVHKFMQQGNPHAFGGCDASKEDAARYHHFHDRHWKQKEKDQNQKLESDKTKKIENLEDYI